jgi:DNA-binding MarR family transcriptional regulator
MSRHRDAQALEPRERDLDFRERGEQHANALDVFTRDLDLPRGPRREAVDEFKLRGSETRALAVVGAFRAVPDRDLATTDQTQRAFSKDIERLSRAGLISATPYMVGRDRCRLLTLTERGREFLESRRKDGADIPGQTYYAGPSSRRELAHDSRILHAYLDAAKRLNGSGGRIQRVVLDAELKRDYQRFLQEPNRGRRAASGEPCRTSEEVRRWAREHELPVIEDSVKFPDLRVEYERPDGERAHEDIEVFTPHYRGAHAASKRAAGFTCYRYGSARISGRQTSNRGGRPRESRLAEELLG